MIKNIRYLPWKERVRLYEEAMRLRKENGWGYVKIGRAIDVHHDVVRHWIHHGRTPMRHGRMKLWKPKPSPELSYIIGVCYGDADVGDRGRGAYRTRFIRLRVNHKEFAERFASCGAKVLGRKQNRIGRERKQYRVCLYSYYLCEFLRNSLEELRPFIETHPSEFIKGFVDSEGCVKVGAVRWKHMRWLDLNISISSTNMEILEYARVLLKRDFSITSKIKSNHKKGTCFFLGGRKCIRTKDAYELIIYRLGDIEIFSNKIGFSIIEKQRKLIDAIDIKKNYGSGRDKYNRWIELYQKANSRWVRKTL